MVHYKWRASLAIKAGHLAPPMTATVRLVSGPDIACNRAGDSLSLWSEDHPGWLVLSCLGCISNPFLTSFALVTSRSSATFPLPSPITRYTSNTSNSLAKVLLHLDIQHSSPPNTFAKLWTDTSFALKGRDCLL